MRRTVLCHFYNEEWLLPSWLKHHREFFDHGIMIDYASTDRGPDIIRELCPTWEIHPSRNTTFDADGVDKEVMDLERPLEGWRITLNATEFLVGNYSYLDDDPTPRQILAHTYSFIDMERREEPFYLDHNRPLWEQRWWGLGGNEREWEKFNKLSVGTPPRSARSIHNHAVVYEYAGRHIWGQEGTHADLVVFHYASASLEESAIKRKMQIQDKIPGGTTHHNMTREHLMARFRNEQSQSRNLRDEIRPIIAAHEISLYQKKIISNQ